MSAPVGGFEATSPQMPGLTPLEFRRVAFERLGNTNLLQVLVRVELVTDSEGAIVGHVSDNLKTMFGVAAKMTRDPLVREKCETMLEL